MPTVFACPPGASLALEFAQWVLAQHTPQTLPRAVVFVPTKRAIVSMRRAFMRAAGGKSMLLPRIIPLTGLDASLPALLGPKAFAMMEAVPQAMPDSQQRYLLTQQVAAFEARRNPGGAVRLDQSLALAEELMRLQDECARHEIALSPEQLRNLAHAGFAEHWEAALQFLSILAESWPLIEQAMELTTKASRETKLLRALAAQWAHEAPGFAVYALGSTASQPATASLLHVIANLAQGAVALPGLDVNTPADEWEAVMPGHPLHHLKQFLVLLGISLQDVKPLASAARNIWQEALLPSAMMPQWATRVQPDRSSLKLLPCQHGEEEARAIALLMREGLESAGRTALITPDESLMARVNAQLAVFGVKADRLRAGSLGETQTGRLWTQLVTAIAEPERILHMRELLHHSLLSFSRDFLEQLEPYLHTRKPRRVDALPQLPEAMQAHPETAEAESLLRQLSKFASAHVSAQAWVEQLQALLQTYDAQVGEGAEPVAEALAAIAAAELPPMGIEEFSALLAERFSAPWRDVGLKADPRLVMLTPVEARLEAFERVIFGNMQENIWPGLPGTGPWLNLAARAQLGLPAPEEQISLMAHDVLVLGSAREVFLSWPCREEGAPTLRSRYVERLVTLLAMHAIKEDAVIDHRTLQWARSQHHADRFAPALPPRPMPSSAQRPARLAVSRLETLFFDPYSIYAEYVLGLRKLEALDAEPDPRDFGTLAHRAIYALTEHWNTEASAADEATLTDITERALRGYSDDPGIDMFWRARLLSALRFVNTEEVTRRQAAPHVKGEEPTEAKLTVGPGKEITLHGRIDRLEGGVIGDYKTGEIDSEKAILEGSALQLLAYAMLCEAAGVKPEAIEYWQLPHARQQGLIRRVEMQALEEAKLPERLREALANMLDGNTPFLAKPGSDWASEDYDGISRYDEWAG